LTIARANDDASATVDLYIKENLTTKRLGSNSTAVGGYNLKSVIQVRSANVTISNLTVQNSLNSVGGRLLNGGGNVTITSVAVRDDGAVGANDQGGTTGVGSNPTGLAGAQVGDSGRADRTDSPARGRDRQRRDDDRQHQHDRFEMGDSADRVGRGGSGAKWAK